MKAALITEEQIKQIEDALEYTTSFSMDQLNNVNESKAILKSLKVREPVAYGHWTSPAWSEEPVSLNTSVENPSGFRADIANWMPLYTPEKPK